ncbi:unnamed protein product [Prunus armeniaca]|uniref:Uncharacterized protein n=1 Tax=Prunus armeniaca TaxID=36596 RepID=A0A6J5WZW7_PRUAR|nr:unnamed protein product [Prunus armeniaca]
MVSRANYVMSLFILVLLLLFSSGAAEAQISPGNPPDPPQPPVHSSRSHGPLDPSSTPTHRGDDPKASGSETFAGRPGHS